MATELNVHMTVWRALHDHFLCIYHLQQIQGLKPASYPTRETLCQCFVQQYAEPPFILSVVFSDEAGFGRDGVIHFHIHYQWAEYNLHGVLQSRHQQQSSIIGNCLVGPRVLPCLVDVPLAIRELFMPGGAPAHFNRVVQDVLNSTYHNQCIGRGHTAWPPRSPGVNPLDFYVWGHSKASCVFSSCSNIETLHQNNVNVFQTIRNYSGIFEWVRQSMMKRAQA
jgi:hypothetical protein